MTIIQKGELMGDLISRQAAIDALNGSLVVDGKENAERVMKYLKGINAKIKALPPVRPEQRWIPVTERLPEENLPVLVAVKQKDRLPKWVKEQTHSYVTDIDVYDDGGFFYTHKNNVVAWMPLPEPYREEEQDD